MPSKDIWALLKEIREAKHLEIKKDEEVFTTRQYAERFGLPPRTAYDQVRKLLAAGTLEIAYMRGRTPFYRVKHQPIEGPSQKTK